MRRGVLIVVCLLIVAAGVVLSVPGPRQEKPVETFFANPYFKEPPATLPEMVAQVDAVVIGRILGGVTSLENSRSGRFQ